MFSTSLWMRISFIGFSFFSSACCASRQAARRHQQGMDAQCWKAREACAASAATTPRRCASSSGPRSPTRTRTIAAGPVLLRLDARCVEARFFLRAGTAQLIDA
jgi:hypothetical protein